MKPIFLFVMFFSVTFFISILGQCQTEENAFVVTDSIRKGTNWNYLQTIDLQKGSYSNMKLQLLDANNKPVNGVAAIAYDKKNKRLYYTPMFQDHLLYVDINSMQIVVVKNSFTGLMPKSTDQSNIITRMVIDKDGFGYAVTNDARHLIQFNTKRNTEVTDLGTLVDAPENKEMSVHNNCSSFGGDIIVDNDRNLYLITSRNHVYKIKISTRLAKYIGTVSGLPINFTTSGVCVDNSGSRLIMVSSNDSSAVYELNIKRLKAKGIGVKNSWLASDLANGKIFQSERKEDDYSKIDFPEILFNYNRNTIDSILLYPNPVTTNEFKIRFLSTASGIYSVVVVNTSGQKLLSKSISINDKNSEVSIKLPELTSKGFFIVSITDKNNTTIYWKKIIVN